MSSAESLERYGVDGWVVEASRSNGFVLTGQDVDGAAVVRVAAERGEDGLHLVAEKPFVRDAVVNGRSGTIEAVDAELADLVVASMVDARRDSPSAPVEPTAFGNTGPQAASGLRLETRPLAGGLVDGPPVQLVGGSATLAACTSMDRMLVPTATALSTCTAGAAGEWPYDEWNEVATNEEGEIVGSSAASCDVARTSLGIASHRHTSTAPLGIASRDTSICNHAARTWLQCKTAVGTGSDRFTYETDHFNNASQGVVVTVRDPEGNPSVFPLSKLTTNRWSDNARLTVTLGMKTDGSKSLRVDDHALKKTASGANSFCTVDASDTDGAACGSTAVYACDSAGCRCLATRQAPSDVWGDALIDMVAGGLAGPLRTLASRGLAHVMVLNTAESGGRGLFYLGQRADPAKFAALFSPHFRSVMSRAIAKQFFTVRPEVVEKLVRLGRSAPPHTATGPLSEVVGHTAVTLGEGREISRQLGREVALQWFSGRVGGKPFGYNFLVFGEKTSVRPFIDKGSKLIWHTHPNIGLPVEPSAADVLFLTSTGQSSSFVIPPGAIPYIFKFWP